MVFINCLLWFLEQKVARGGQGLYHFERQLLGCYWALLDTEALTLNYKLFMLLAVLSVVLECYLSIYYKWQ